MVAFRFRHVQTLLPLLGLRSSASLSQHQARGYQYSQRKYWGWVAGLRSHRHTLVSKLHKRAKEEALSRRVPWVHADSLETDENTGAGRSPYPLAFPLHLTRPLNKPGGGKKGEGDRSFRRIFDLVRKTHKFSRSR